MAASPGRRARAIGRIICVIRRDLWVRGDKYRNCADPWYRDIRERIVRYRSNYTDNYGRSWLQARCKSREVERENGTGLFAEMEISPAWNKAVISVISNIAMSPWPGARKKIFYFSEKTETVASNSRRILKATENFMYTPLFLSRTSPTIDIFVMHSWFFIGRRAVVLEWPDLYRCFISYIVWHEIIFHIPFYIFVSCFYSSDKLILQEIREWSLYSVFNIRAHSCTSYPTRTLYYV